MKASRQTVDLTPYPDLIVIYLGMRVNVFAGIKTLLGFGPKIESSVALKPDGLLSHENIIYSLFPPHIGMRQYWRDFESLERWTRAEPHQYGGNNSCGILAGPVSGTNSILRVVALNPYISMSKNPLAFCGLPMHSPQKAAFSQPATACVATA